jgi:predicted metal-dependent HD superfamily phosphohydrolase
MVFVMALSISLPNHNYTYHNYGYVSHEDALKNAMISRLKKHLMKYFYTYHMDDILDEILNYYKQPWRKFHTIQHVHDIIDMIDDNPVLSKNIDVYGKLILCAIYHDIVYKPWRTDNEIQSAKLFKRHCDRYGKLDFTDDARNFVFNCILQTKNRDGNHYLEHIFNSMDMYIISGTKTDVLKWEQENRFEFGYISNKKYKELRISFLDKFREHGNIEFLIEHIKQNNKGKIKLYFIKYLPTIIKEFFKKN